MTVLFTDILRQTQNGRIAEALTDAMQEANQAAIASRKPAELTLKIKIIPEASGRQTTVEFDVATKLPRGKLPKGVFWMGDDYSLLRADPDQQEMKFTDAGDGRPYTPPRQVG